nr:MAG TPA: hypothetical protein [Crassvirales sp.]
MRNTRTRNVHILSRVAENKSMLQGGHVVYGVHMNYSV